MSVVGDNIKSMRKALHMSQMALAQQSGISQAAISAIESGAITRTPYTDTIGKIASALGCTVSELMGDVETETKEYTHDELRLLAIVQRLNSLGVEKVIEYASDLADNDKYTQEASAASVI